MNVQQSVWKKDAGWVVPPQPFMSGSCRLVLVFGASSALTDTSLLGLIADCYPDALLAGCSTAGEIAGTMVSDDSLAVTAISFSSSHVASASIQLSDAGNAVRAGEQLAKSLPQDGLVHVFVLSDGISVNGSDLVKGLMQGLPEGVTVTGGLAADGDRFQKTFIIENARPVTGAISAIGFYGKDLMVGCGSLGGWDPFGPERRITRSRGNVLYELDGQSALQLYRRYLGEHAKGLPATALLFPLSLRTHGHAVVRTVLSTNDDDQSMTFAGDMPKGAYTRLMKANLDRLVDGAVGAARMSFEALGGQSPDLAVLISCVGRKMVMKQRTEEEVEGVRSVFGGDTVMSGFYSYGELAPFAAGEACTLHNQTMTITAFRER